MAKYSSYKYFYPPRPKNAIPAIDLDGYDNGTFIAQPKLNGSNISLFQNGEINHTMNRHKERLTNFKLTNEELNEVYRGCGEWSVLNGEYMNKSKKDGSNLVFNDKLVIFDLLVLDGNYLIGHTFQQRVELMDEVFGTKESEYDYLYKITDNIYRVKSFESGFKAIYDELTPIDMIEGLVLKRKNARLEMGLTESNNTRSQLKARKATKNYKY